MIDGYTDKERECWDGVERRVHGQLAQFQSLLTSHTKDEMERYGEIIDRVDQVENKVTHVDKTVAEMNKNLLSFMETYGSLIKAITRAFPKDEEGKPDYDGHNKAHISWMRSAAEDKELMEFVRRQRQEEEENKEFKKYVKRVVTAGVTLGVVAWLWAVVWPALLKGPM